MGSPEETSEETEDEEKDKDAQTGYLSGTSKVFQFSNTLTKSLVNLSLSFSAENLALVSDGYKTLYLLSTGSRESSTQSWKVLFEEEVIEAETGFVILDSKYVRDEQKLTCVLLSVIDAKSMDLKITASSEEASKFVSFLKILSLVEDENHKWIVKSKKELYCSGEIEYAALEKNLDHLCVISKEPLVFFSDTESPVLEDNLLEDLKENGTRKIDYYWQQTSDKVTLWFSVSSTFSENQISVDVHPSELNVRCGDKILLQGSLHANVAENQTTWTLDRNKLEISLAKHEPGLMWPSVVRNNVNGEEIKDPALVEEIHERLAHLCSETEVKAKDIGDMCAPTFNMDQLEECDAISCDSRLFSRVSLTAHSVSHQAYLSGVQWLFNCRIACEQGQGFCLRHDVDGCVWIPKAESSGWKCEHTATFLALGYVQASKTQKKFIICPPDFSYAAICETTRHVYVYKQACSVSSELRNRKSGSKIGTIAKQQLINLPSNEEVLGIQATNQSLFVLTSAHLYSLDIV